MLQSWRGNCDLQILLYNADPDKLDAEEIAHVIEYVFIHACKGNEKLKTEKNRYNL